MSKEKITEGLYEALTDLISLSISDSMTRHQKAWENANLAVSKYEQCKDEESKLILTQELAAMLYAKKGAKRTMLANAKYDAFIAGAEWRSKAENIYE